MGPPLGGGVCLIGDSRTQGIQDLVADASGDIGNLAHYIGATLGYINGGVSGDTAGTALTGSWTNRIALAHYCTSVVDELGINDIATGSSLAVATAARAAVDALFPFVPVYGTTLEPETTSTDSFATTANQTVSAWNATVRIPFNAAIRAGAVGEVNYIDLAHMVDPTDSGKWPVTGAASGCTLDGVHEINVSNQLEQNATPCGVFMNPFRNIDFSGH